MPLPRVTDALRSCPPPRNLSSLLLVLGPVPSHSSHRARGVLCYSVFDTDSEKEGGAEGVLGPSGVWHP